MWQFLLLEVRPPPPRCIQRCTRLLSVALELVEMPLSRPSFPCWEGWNEAVLLKKPIRLRNIVHTSWSSCLKLATDNIRNLCQCRQPPRGQSKGRGAIRMPWAMPLWHGLVQLLQLAAKEHNDNNTDKATLTKLRQQ
jgi:hypothetical protein